MKSKIFIIIFLILVLGVGGYYGYKYIVSTTILPTTISNIPDIETYSDSMLISGCVTPGCSKIQTKIYTYTKSIDKIYIYSDPSIGSWWAQPNPAGDPGFVNIRYKIYCYVAANRLFIKEFSHNVVKNGDLGLQKFLLEGMPDTCTNKYQIEVETIYTAYANNPSVSYDIKSIPKTFSNKFATLPVDTAKTLSCDNKYLYCSFNVSDCAQLKDNQNGMIYNCIDANCIGYYKSNPLPTLQCLIPIQGKIPLANEYIHSYQPIITCAPGKCITGEKRCSTDLNNVQECKDTDNSGDGCGESFQNVETCGGTLECKDIAGTVDCVCENNQCTPGQPVCEGNAIRNCVQDANGCYVNSPTLTQCASDETCSGGVCGCGTTICSEGTIDCLDSKNYKQCGVYSGVCPEWSTNTLNCGNEKVCVEPNGCVCPADPATTRRKTAGTNNQYQLWELWGNNQCKSWNPTSYTCPSNQVTDANGYCGCGNNPYGEGYTECLSTTTYREFSTQYGQNGCPAFSGVLSCNLGESCTNGDCVCPTTPANNLRCSDSTHYQRWGAKQNGVCNTWGDPVACLGGQSCNNGICSCPTNVCTNTNSDDDTECRNNEVWECQSVGGNCPTMQKSLSCDVSQACIKHSPAQCVEPFTITVNFADSYGINEEIVGIVKVQNSAGSNSGLRVFGQLIQDVLGVETIIEQTPVANTNLNGEVTTLKFRALGNSKDATLRFFVSDTVLGVTAQAEKAISTKPQICVSLSAPIVAKVGQQLTVSTSIKNCDTGVDLTTTLLMAEVMQNGIQIPFTITSNQIKFIPTSDGDFVQIKATASQSGFLEGQDALTIAVEEPLRKVDLLIDNVNINNIEGNVIDLGTLSLKLELTLDGATPLDVDQVIMKIIEPSGVITPLAVSKESAGKYRATYNFVEASQNYKLEYTIIKYQRPTDAGFTTTDQVTFVTTGDRTPGEEIIATGTTTILIVTGVIVVLLSVLIVWFIFRRKK